MRGVRSCFTWPLLLLVVSSCAGQRQEAAAPDPSLTPIDRKTPCSQVGMASWYGGSSRDHGSPQDLVAAHRSLPFGTPLLVTAIDTGQSIVVRINDRGPFGPGRIIDLSRAAADQLGMRHEGVALVRLEPVGSTGSGEGCPFKQSRSD
jgi:rare lipoprotein A